MHKKGTLDDASISRQAEIMTVISRLFVRYYFDGKHDKFITVVFKKTVVSKRHNKTELVFVANRDLYVLYLSVHLIAVPTHQHYIHKLLYTRYI